MTAAAHSRSVAAEIIDAGPDPSPVPSGRWHTRRDARARRRQLRLLHLQPRPPPRGARAPRSSCAERLAHRHRGARASTRSARRLAWPGTPARRGSIDGARSSSSGATTPTLGVCLGHQAIVEALRWRDRAGSVARPREGEHDRATTAVESTPAFPREIEVGRYHSLAATRDPGDPRGHSAHRRRRGDGRAPPRASDRRRPVPPGERPDAERAATMLRTFLDAFRPACCRSRLAVSDRAAGRASRTARSADSAR